MHFNLFYYRKNYSDAALAQASQTPLALCLPYIFMNVMVIELMFQDRKWGVN